jgi:hypothetical protein
MASKIILEVPEDIPESALKKAREAAVLALWEEGGLSTSDAASELGLTYHDFLDLTGKKGLTAEGGPLNLETIQETERLRDSRPE